MLSTITSLALASIFVCLAAVSVWLILESAPARSSPDRSQRLIAAHRISGYAFVGLFCVMVYYMIRRTQEGASISGPATIHLTLAFVLAPLLFLKILLARRYRTQMSAVMPLGMLIFVLAFVVVGVASWPYLRQSGTPVAVSLEPIGLPAVSLNVDAAASLMQQKCSKCHTLDRVVGANKDAKGWAATLARMQSLPSSGLTDSDIRTILAYLTSRSQKEDAASQLAVARAIVDQRCGRCHTLDRIYSTTQSPDQWRQTVSRMEEYAAGSAGAFRPGEAEQITGYLSATQTPEAMNRRMASAKAKPAERTVNTIAGKENAARAGGPLPDIRSIAFGAFVLVGIVALAARRPKNSAPVAAASIKAPQMEGHKKTILKLVSIVQQTAAAKTLRFVLPPGSHLHARPGQYLSFTFLFDGTKEIRCYSICSSPARSGYIEITPKLVKGGCVSVYLNERAHVGLTVEASGPFGDFYFDPGQHRSIVLIAAGSGITPMMAMLGHISDLCLDTQATLLYCVRSVADIMFRSELEDLQSRVSGFRYHVQLSQPDPDWRGWSGHISDEFVSSTLLDIAEPEFFLCGPPPFMELARGILIKRAVKPERIHQERFGGPPRQVSNESGSPGFHASFLNCEKRVPVRREQTLLQVAEQAGVNIPYSCRQGQCGTCMTKLIEGSVTMDSEVGLDPKSKARGYILPCVSRPNSDVHLEA